jgi:hypothetical protein
MPKFELRSNQYIPYRGKRLQSGMPASATYFYFVNENGKVVDLQTLKPYKGKQMNRYAMHDKKEANSFLKLINKTTTHKVEKPKGTFYSDYTIKGDCCYAIFENCDGRVNTKLVCKTKKTNDDWKTFNIKETKRNLFINLGE